MVEVGIEQHKVAPHLNSMHKYSGIGYAYDEGRRVRALYLGDGSFQEAIRPA